MMNSFFLFLDGLLSSSDKSSSSGSDETALLTVGSIPADGRGMTNMLLVSSSVWMVYGIHSHSSNSGPSSSLCSVFVPLVSGLDSDKLLAADKFTAGL